VEYLANLSLLTITRRFLNF